MSGITIPVYGWYRDVAALRDDADRSEAQAVSLEMRATELRERAAVLRQAIVEAGAATDQGDGEA